MGVLLQVPLAAQAFGAQNYRRVGVLLQRQQVIHLALCLPVLLAWWNTEQILLLLGQPADLARSTAVYLRWRMPGLPFMYSVPALHLQSTHFTHEFTQRLLSVGLAFFHPLH